MVDRIIKAFDARLNSELFIYDWTRSIRDETAFKDYLEKYFGFRNGYCNLNIKYKSGVGLVVKMLYSYRNTIKAE